MTRTTISRSSLLMVAIALAAPAAGAAAQDTLQTAEAESTRRHIVREGETLWAIAQMYLGDPFLWPAIYRLNTLVVEDPHWIFPGEELRLVPPDTTTVAVTEPEEAEPERPVEAAEMEGAEQAAERPPVAQAQEAVEAPDAAPPPPPPAAETGPTVFAQTTRRGEGAAQSFSIGLPAQPVARGAFYAAGFLTENEDIPWARVLGTVRGGEVVAGRTEVSSALPFERVRIRAPSGATYQVGDSLLTARIGREQSGWGHIVSPSGIVRVVHVAGRDVLAEVVRQFNRITERDVAIPLEPFHAPGPVQPQPVEQGVEGRVIAARDVHPVSMQQEVLFIDLGRQDGVVPGDIFEVVRPTGEATLRDEPAERLATLQIVHVRQRSATGIVTQIHAAGTRAGVPVRLIRKMPS